MKELEFLRSLGPFRRFAYRILEALEGLFTERGQTDAIKEAIQITGEVQIARTELTTLELKKSQTVREIDEMLTAASTHKRKIIEDANQRASEKVEEIYKESRELVAAERRDYENVRDGLTQLKAQMGDAHKELANLNDERYMAQARMRVQGSGTSGFSGYSGYSGFSGHSGYQGGRINPFKRHQDQSGDFNEEQLQS